MSRFRTPFAACFLVAVVSLLAPKWAAAQVGGGGFGFGGQAVGGIAIDARGIVGNLDPKALESLAAERQKALADLVDGGPSDLRKVSLARIIAAVEGSIAGKAPLPADVLFLGGLERSPTSSLIPRITTSCSRGLPTASASMRGATWSARRAAARSSTSRICWSPSGLSTVSDREAFSARSTQRPRASPA
jgi:hypothetical protein